MIAPDIETGIARLNDLVNAARVILPFTGAGISTECGIPDFRSPGGLWSRLQPIPFDRFMASAAMRDESWRRRFAMETEFSTARPGRGHRALASLHRMGKIPAVITQNIPRQYDLRHLPRLRPALRARLGPRALRGRGPCAGLRGMRRLCQNRNDLVRPGHAGGGDDRFILHLLFKCLKTLGSVFRNRPDT